VKRTVALALLVSRAAHAQPGDDAAATAKEFDRAGREHYEAKDYAAAVEDYRHAYDALPDPLFLFDIAQAYRQLHDCDHAREMYRRYLHDQPDADNRARVEQFITDMDACATAATTTPAVVTHTPPAASSPNTLQLTGIGTAALGLLLVGAGVYFSIDASHDASMLEAACARGCDGADVANLDRAGHESSRDAMTTYALGGAALAAGAGMFLWATFHAAGEPPVVAPVQGGATVSARIRF
jgi:tetratricopeptide (TPR) repeat protein